MSTEQVFITQEGPFTVPETYVLSQSETFRPSVINATFNGAGASGSFLPCCTIYSQTGKLISRTFPETVAAGDTAEVTYGPFLKAPVSVGAAATPPPAAGGPFWLKGGYRGAIFLDPTLLAYYRLGAAPHLLDDEVTAPTNDPMFMHNGAVAGTSVAGPPQIADGNDGYRLNAAADVDGDYFGIPASNAGPGSKFAGVASFSVECWILPNQQAQLTNPASQVNRGPIIWSRVDSLGVRSGWTLTAEYGNPYGGTNIGLSLVPSGSDAAVIGPIALVAGGSPTLAASWYHVAFTFNAADNVARLYLNGALAGTATGTIFSPAPIGTPGFTGILVGAGFPIDFGGINRQRGFVGIIDEAAWYTRVLSQAEVLLHFNASGLDSDTGHWITTGTAAGALIGDAAVDTTQLADSSVSTAKIQDSAVTSAKILDGTIVAADISGTLKPSGSAGAGTEALRALGATASTAAAGTDHRLGNPPSSGALSTVSPVSGTAFQVDTTVDRELLVPVTLTPTAGAAATCLVELSPDNVTYTTVGTLTVPAGTALDSIVDVLTVRVPQSWRVRLTATNAAIGTGVYY